MKKIFPYPFYISFWFWWLLLTTLYLFLFHGGGSFNQLDAIVGLFVPFGFFNVWMSVEKGVWVRTFPILIIFIFFFDTLIYKIGIRNYLLKLILTILALVLVTFLVDYFIYGQWQSYSLFLNPDQLGDALRWY